MTARESVRARAKDEGHGRTREKKPDRKPSFAELLTQASAEDVQPDARTQPTLPDPVEKNVEGVVNWFKKEKEIGFISRASGGKDVFVHLSAVQRAGLQDLAKGQAIVFDIGTDYKQRASAQNLRVVEGAAKSTAAPTAKVNGTGAEVSAPVKTPQAKNGAAIVATNPNVRLNGSVKWFNAQKGFGFFIPDDGGGDIFVHISAVRAASLETLHKGERFSFSRALVSGKPVATELKRLD